MKRFIRLDMKGEWRGKEHCSSFCGLGEYEDDCFEKGISCYELSDIEQALTDLYNYWTKTATCWGDDYKKMQVTIFEGHKLDGKGTDWEDLATCEKTILEKDAYEFMNTLIKYHEALENDYDEDELMMTEDEYEIACKELYKSLFE